MKFRRRLNGYSADCIDYSHDEGILKPCISGRRPPPTEKWSFAPVMTSLTRAFKLMDGFRLEPDDRCDWWPHHCKRSGHVFTTSSVEGYEL